MTIRGAFICGVLAAFVAGSTSARAESVCGRVHYRAGLLYYDDGVYQKAVREFETAYSFGPDAKILWRLALGHARLADSGRTMDYLRQYTSAAPKAPNHSEAIAWLHSLEMGAGPLDKMPSGAERMALSTPSPPVEAGLETLPQKPESTPIHQHWAFWTGVSVVVIGVVVASVLLSARSDDDSNILPAPGGM